MVIWFQYQLLWEMQCLSLGNVKNIQPYLLVQKGFCAEKSHPHFVNRACKGIFRPAGVHLEKWDGGAHCRAWKAKHHMEERHGWRTWVKSAWKKNIMLFLLEKNKVVRNRRPLHPMLHMTGPTGMKVEELPINKARKINRTLVYAVPARCEGWDSLALVSTFFHAIWTIRPATSPNSGEPQRCLKLILNDWLKGEQLSKEIWLWNLQMQPIGSGGVRIPLTRCWLGRWYRYN